MNISTKLVLIASNYNASILVNVELPDFWLNAAFNIYFLSKVYCKIPFNKPKMRKYVCCLKYLCCVLLPRNVKILRKTIKTSNTIRV